MIVLDVNLTPIKVFVGKFFTLFGYIGDFSQTLDVAVLDLLLVVA